MDIEINILKDLEIQFKSELSNYGYLNIPEDADKLFIAYFKILHRAISNIPRKIFKSDVFTIDAKYSDGLDYLEDKLSKGENTNIHQSKNILDLNQNDSLLDDWGIHHLHLGSKVSEDGFIERSGPLLYLFLTEDSAYFLNILKHGEWENDELLAILDRNWPSLISHWHVKNLIDIENIDQKSRRLMRKVGGVTFTKVNNKIFAPPGGGYMSSGTSTNALIASDKFINRLQNIEKDILNNKRNYEKILKKNLGVKPYKIQLKSSFYNGILYLIEENFNIRFPFEIKF